MLIPERGGVGRHRLPTRRSRGKVIKVGSVLYGGITTADATVAIIINGTAVSILMAGARAGCR
jgi:hypothetical protein